MAEIWLTFNNQEQGFRIPIMPPSIEIGDGNKSKTYDIINTGEINVIKSPKLTEYAFSSIFPAQHSAYVSVPGGELLPPKKMTDAEPNGYVDYILEWMAAKKPIRFSYVGERWNVNEPVSIEGFTWKEVAGSVGDIEYSIKLKKYVFYAAQKIIVKPPKSSVQVATIEKEPPPRPDERVMPATYTLVAGDTLWKVAKQILGDGARWKEIQKYNDIPDAKLKSLPIGTVLRIPS